MLAKIDIQLRSEMKTLSYLQSSNLQGVLMEQINPEYADKLHVQGLNPYSQSLEIRNEERLWTIKTLTREAYENIIVPLSAPEFDGFEIRQKKMRVEIFSKKIQVEKKEKLYQEFYSTDDVDRFIKLIFMTPTSFKRDGKYCNMPDARLVFQSLMNKYSASSKEMDMTDEDTLQQLAENAFIARYRLRSVSFPLEGVNIPSFMGEMTIKINGPTTMVRYARLLARFGEYSGVGIKTGMGMGALKLIRRGQG